MATLIVDGYNIIHQWDWLKKEAENVSWEAARHRLIDLLAEYQAYTDTKVILVFDGYLTDRPSPAKSEELGVEIIFTSRRQTADSFIERLVYKLVYKKIRAMPESSLHGKNKKNTLLVATADVKIAQVIFGWGAFPVSPDKLKEMINSTKQELEEFYMKKGIVRHRLGDVVKK